MWTKVSQGKDLFHTKYEFSGGNVRRCSKSNFPGDFKGASAFFRDRGKMKLSDNVLSVLIAQNLITIQLLGTFFGANYKKFEL